MDQWNSNLRRDGHYSSPTWNMPSRCLQNCIVYTTHAPPRSSNIYPFLWKEERFHQKDSSHRVVITQPPTESRNQFGLTRSSLRFSPYSRERILSPNSEGAWGHRVSGEHTPPSHLDGRVRIELGSIANERILGSSRNASVKTFFAIVLIVLSWSQFIALLKLKPKVSLCSVSSKDNPCGYAPIFAPFMKVW